MTDYDVVVAGSGAGGATIAHSLAATGKRILILERGDFLRRGPDNWDPHAVFVDGRYVSQDDWYDGRGRVFQPQAHYFVGGATKLYGAALFRLRPKDFTEYQRADGTSPAWPLTYDDMERWYTQAEHLYQVHGQHGADPTAGWVSAPYPHPPVSHEPRIARIHELLATAGYSPFHAPCGIMLDETRPHSSRCVRCHLCDGYPCPVAAKADAQTIAIDPILGLPNVSLRTGAVVTRFYLKIGSPGSVASVEFRNDRGEPERVTADTFVLSAGAVNSAKVLLNSGLANSSDQLGRNYMCHNSRAVIAVGHEPNPTRFQKTLALHDFYDTLGSIQMLGKSNPDAMRGESLAAQLMPTWSTKRITGHAVDFWLMTEDVPLRGNRVTVSSRGVRLSVRQTGDREMDALYGHLKKLMGLTGIVAHKVLNRNLMMYKGMPLAAVAHQAGTCRFGTDPALSVLDVNCRVHDLDNLYVVDASFMPSIGAVNPALTIMANALRVGDHLARN
jgi:choline dehydrogenase-like flavoprotein